MSGRVDKAQRYIALLDTARTSGSWGELPELIRKVTKHAPQRKCLLRTASLEHAIIQHISAAGQNKTSAAEPSPLSESNLSALEREIKSTNQKSEDAIQGQASLLWARWATSKTEISPMPDNVALDAYGDSGEYSVWTNICLVKSAYVRGMLYNKAGLSSEAVAALQSIVPWLKANRTFVLSTPQLLYWSQQLLAQSAVSRGEQMAAHSTDQEATVLSETFRQWAALSSKSRDVSSVTYGYVGPQRSNISLWKAYYVHLSALLQSGKPAVGENSNLSASDQASELRRVENSYENELLRTTQFPTASQSNELIENWVEQVIYNWHILCGPQWSEADLGEGGRNSMGRNVLDVLYRAAMKSFQSTLILRRLFQVHKALADFDLAYEALDTYLELIERGRERAAKANEVVQGEDGDEIVIRTMSEGIEGLCSFGRHAEAEMVYQLCLRLEKFLGTSNLLSGLYSATDSRPNGRPENHIEMALELPPQTRMIFHRALGIGKAHWAKWTAFNEMRSSLQAEAIAHLITAVELPISREDNIQSIYALGLVLAETREIDKAVEYIKVGLTKESSESPTGTYALERRLIPVWHLLALLLTSRQDFDTAGQSCVAAFEQFSSPDFLFGIGPGRSTASQKQSEKLADGGLVDDMECDELQRIVEIQITELALTELLEGPENAVNSSNDLLALYFRLFGHLRVATDANPGPKLMEPPQSSAATVKSFRGSVFGRRKVTSSSEIFKEKANGAASIKTDTTRPTTRATQAPRIHVTNEDEKRLPHKHRLLRRSEERSRHEKRHSKDSHHLRLARPGSRDVKGARSLSNISSQRQSFETSHERPQSSTGTAETAQPHLEPIQSVNEVPAASEPAKDHDSSPQAKQPLKEIRHSLASHNIVPPPAHHDSQPPEQDIRLHTLNPSTSSTSPPPRFPLAAAQKHALTVLTKIWLVIAKLYRRASMFEDAREACDEAAKSSLRIETLIAGVESSARAFADPGWGGGGKSSDEVWADVYCERAELSLATARLREEKNGGDVDHEGVREAVEHFETCLMYFADHPGGIVGLSSLLLDYYERKVELGRKVDDGRAAHAKEAAPGDVALKNRSHVHRVEDRGTSNGTVESVAPNAVSGLTDEDLKKTPENLNRLAARDRAYGLLSTLTKLGSGWDSSEAWYALARAHELGGEIDKAKEILWWCVELEDTRPIRHWRNLGCSGYVLS